MSNQLKMAEHQSTLGLYRLNWSYRRIAKELGVDRQTVSRHVKTAAQDQVYAAPAVTSRPALRINSGLEILPASAGWASNAGTSGGVGSVSCYGKPKFDAEILDDRRTDAGVPVVLDWRKRRGDTAGHPWPAFLDVAVTTPSLQEES